MDFDFPGSEVETGHSYTYSYQSMMNVRRVLMVDDSLVTLKTQVTCMHACASHAQDSRRTSLTHSLNYVWLVATFLRLSCLSVCLSFCLSVLF